MQVSELDIARGQLEAQRKLNAALAAALADAGKRFTRCLDARHNPRQVKYECCRGIAAVEKVLN